MALVPRPCGKMAAEEAPSSLKHMLHQRGAVKHGVVHRALLMVMHHKLMDRGVRAAFYPLARCQLNYRLCGCHSNSESR
ncbi:uncharacterized [Tachysurus ichikawai]